MSLQFIRGKADQDLAGTLLAQAQEWLAADSQNEVFYLVPNNIKFEQEIQTLKRLRDTQGMFAADDIAATRLQVFSFYRLAWYFLQHTPYYGQEMLSEAGAAMIFRRILQEKQEELKIFRGEVDKPGFIRQLFELYLEMKNGQIEFQTLAQQLAENQATTTSDLQVKWQDLQLLFTEFEARIAAYELQSTEIFEHLASYLQTQPLEHVLFIVSGYEQFSAREVHLLQVLLQKAGAVKIGLFLDRKYPQQLPEPMNLFFQTGQTYFALYQLARQLQVPVLPDLVVKKRPTLQSEALQQLSDFWVASNTGETTKGPASLADSPLVQLWRAESPKEEITQLAVEIRRLVSEEGYRYQDIQLVTRDMAFYEYLVGPIFASHDIPLYLDRDIAMAQHPLVEFIQALFAMQRYHYRYRDVLRFLRTELYFPFPETETELTLAAWEAERDAWRHKIDSTENVVLAYGYEGSVWQKSADWTFITYDYDTQKLDDTQKLEAESNEVRRLIQQHIPGFFEKMKHATNGRQAAQVFYEFLVAQQVEQQLMMWRNQAIEQGYLEEAVNHEQTWQALMTLLDEYVTIYGETAFDFTVFEDVFTSGLEELRYNKVPTAIDQVQMRPLDVVRPAQAKVIVAIGLTEQVFPKRVDNQSLLSDDERQQVNEVLDESQYLLNEAQKVMANEPFVAYKLFNSATERLYFSYPCTQDTNHTVKISPYLARLKQGLKLKESLRCQLVITDGEATSLRHISTYRTLISDLTTLKQQEKEQVTPLHPFWLSLEQALLEQPQATLATRVFASLAHKNVPAQLTRFLAEQLYGKQIYTSVSRMESFHRCQYQYFLQYGLGLKERAYFSLNAAATGDFFHEALDQLFKALIRSQKNLTELTNEEVHQLADQVLELVFDQPKFSILNASKRMHYVRYQLGQTIKKVSWALKKQSERSGMTTVQTEVLFGQIAAQQGIRGLELDLDHQGKMLVRGKIDRIDQLAVKEDVYLGVIDYKSSQKKFNISDAYDGLAMQMLTYLDVTLMNAVQLVGQPAKPAGSLYLHVQNPVLAYEKGLTDSQDPVLKKFQFNGLLLNEPGLLQELDQSLQPKQSSLIYPIEESAKEIIKPGRRQEDKFLNEPELNALLAHNRQNFVKAGNQILAGALTLEPAYQGKERIACRFCPFRSVCEFDVMLPENNYHRLEKRSKQAVMNELLPTATDGGVEDESKDSPKA